MNTDIDSQQQLAAQERALRVVELAKTFARIVKVVDNTTVTVEIEVKPNETVEIDQVKQLITAIMSGVSQTTEQMDILFMMLAKKYQDNDIIISVTDSSDCGMKTVYNSSKPIQSLKI